MKLYGDNDTAAAVADNADDLCTWLLVNTVAMYNRC